MLQADKRVLLAGAKKDALELRSRELDFNVERYTNLATQASVMAGFSFESLVELEVPEGTNEYLSSIYFVFASLAMSLSLYVLCMSSFAVIYGHRLALQGPHGSLERAVGLLMDYRGHIFTTAGVALACLVVAAVCMSWIKMGPAAGAVTSVFLAFIFCVTVGMNRMAQIFDIPEEDIVTGAMRVHNPSAKGAQVDLALLSPGSKQGVEASCAKSPLSSAASSSTRFSGAEGQYARLPDSHVTEQQESPADVLHHEVRLCMQPISMSSPMLVPLLLHDDDRTGLNCCARLCFGCWQGYLFKKAGNSKISQASRSLSLDASRRRYFVLRGTKVRMCTPTLCYRRPTCACHTAAHLLEMSSLSSLSSTSSLTSIPRGKRSSITSNLGRTMAALASPVLSTRALQLICATTYQRPQMMPWMRRGSIWFPSRCACMHGHAHAGVSIVLRFRRCLRGCVPTRLRACTPARPHAGAPA